MKDFWSYDNAKHVDKNGEQWHFVSRTFLSEDVPYKERPIEIYFRNESRTYYGLIRYELSKDNPYKHEKLVEKVMRDKEFREKYIAQETKDVWRKNWK